MATTLPQSAPPPSASFINMEDFDDRIPDPDAPQNNAQNVSGVRNQPLPFIYNTASNANIPVSDNASSEAGGSTASSTLDLGGINWIGRLLEYHQAHPATPAPHFAESTVPGYVPRFVCLVNLSEHSEPFGSIAHPFSKKKDAKQHSCKLAIEWLVENGHMPSIDSVTFPRGHTQSAPQSLASGAASTATFAAAPSTDLTPAAKVVQLCLELRFNPPAYVLTSEPAAPMLWSGYAHFPNDPRVDGRIGEFNNVFGKKNAKEQCVEQVLAFLQGVKGHRESTAMEA